MMSFVTEEKMINSTKLMTLYTADEHTLCSYFVIAFLALV
jgi:hypothetical protein